jgi:hypothetical protein
MAVTEDTATRKRVPGPCECKCGGHTKGGRFLPGHDARLRGELLSTLRDSSKRKSTRQKALEQLQEHRWEHGMSDEDVAALA